MTATDTLALLGTPIVCTPARRAVLLRLAQADRQTWTEDQRGSGWNDHMAEVMYGTAADIVEEIVAEHVLIDADEIRRNNKKVWWQGYNAAERDDAAGAKTIAVCPYDKPGRHV